eukprot:796180-Rhodomonas_salina.1
MPGTDPAYGVHSWRIPRRCPVLILPRYRPQALAPPMPVRLSEQVRTPLRVRLRACYAISRPGLRYQPMQSPVLGSAVRVRVLYSMSGTDVGSDGPRWW